MELYNAGLLCKCTRIEDILVIDEDDSMVEEKMLKHEANCSGRDTVKNLLDME